MDLPAEKRLVMPRITEELRDKMRRSIAFEKNVNICHEGLSVISLFCYEKRKIPEYLTEDDKFIYYTYIIDYTVA